MFPELLKAYSVLTSVRILQVPEVQPQEPQMDQPRSIRALVSSRPDPVHVMANVALPVTPIAIRYKQSSACGEACGSHICPQMCWCLTCLATTRITN